MLPCEVLPNLVSDHTLSGKIVLKLDGGRHFRTPTSGPSKCHAHSHRYTQMFIYMPYKNSKNLSHKVLPGLPVASSAARDPLQRPAPGGRQRGTLMVQ